MLGLVGGVRCSMINVKCARTTGEVVVHVDEDAFDESSLCFLKHAPLQLSVELLQLRDILRVSDQLGRLIDVLHLLDRARYRRQRELHVRQARVRNPLAVVEQLYSLDLVVHLCMLVEPVVAVVTEVFFVVTHHVKFRKDSLVLANSVRRNLRGAGPPRLRLLMDYCLHLFILLDRFSSFRDDRNWFVVVCFHMGVSVNSGARPLYIRQRINCFVVVEIDFAVL